MRGPPSHRERARASARSVPASRVHRDRAHERPALRPVARAMLSQEGMKTFVASLIFASLTGTAFAGPDFNTRSPRPDTLAASPGSKEIGPLDDVVFATNSTQLTEGAFAQLDGAAKWLKKHPRQQVVLEGYADSVGMEMYNEDLATRRAFVIRQQLIANGVAGNRIIMVVYGEGAARGGENPLDRRVVMYTTKLAPRQIARASIDKKQALSVSWQQGKAMVSETKPRAVVGAR